MLTRRTLIAAGLGLGPAVVGVALYRAVTGGGPGDASIVASAPQPGAGLSTPEPAADPAGSPAADIAESAATPSATMAPSFAGITDVPAEVPRRTEVITYTVEPGDVLWQLAERFGLRAETVLWANPEVDDPSLLLVGQRLTIPPTDGVLYTVQAGERLADIALRYGLDTHAITTANRLADADQISAGVDLFLPNARPLRAATRADVVTAPPAEEPVQQAAAVLPPIPLPANIDVLLQAGWLRAARGTSLFRGPDPQAGALTSLPAGVRLERVEGLQGGRIPVRDPGDGRTRQAMSGWIDAVDVAIGSAPSARELPQAYPSNTAMDIAHFFAPYRSQLDGSPYAAANCGPTTIGMALEAYGTVVSSGQLRTETLNAQRIWGNDVGTLITALVEVVQRYGLRTFDLFVADTATPRRWSLDDVRAHLKQGRPVVAQVRYRALPGRGAAAYFGDHYILLTGVLGNGSFLYNDSINSDGVGWDRVLAPDRLFAAMDASDRRYAYAAFSVGR